MSRSRWVRGMLAALFFATGFCGLGYQVLWARRFAAGLGHEFPAVLATISAFMGGIALGAFLYGRIPFLQRSRRAYGWLELGIGAWAVISVAAIPAANRVAIWLMGADPSAAWHWAVAFVAVLLTLLPATAAMGATFPAVERLLASPGSARQVPLLYAANTAGAMAGALAAAFWLMPRLGISGSILALAAVNVGCGLAACGSWVGWGQPGEATGRDRQAAGPGRGLAGRLFLTGFLGIGLETLLMRGLSQVLQNTVFTFAAVLATFLGATALGAALLPRFRVRLPGMFAALALASCAAGLLLRAVPAVYPGLRARLGDSVAGVAAAETLTAAVVMLGPALAMGATFAALAEQSLRIRPHLGWALAWNTAGAALAPACFGLLLLPGLGLNGALALATTGYLALAGKSKWLWAVIPLAALFPFLPSTATLLAKGEGDRILFHREGAMASVAVLEGTNGSRVLKVNNRFQMGGTAARAAEERHAFIPLLLHPAPRRALFIGLGTGITFHAAAHFPGLRADGVELLKGVLEAMPLFGEAGAQQEFPGLREHLADGRRFVLSTRERYDVVVADLFHPAQDGAAFLYTREHFAAVRARLAPGGLFCQWLPVFQMDLETLRTIAQTFLAVFPEAEAWLLRPNVDTPVIGLISQAPRRQDDFPKDNPLAERLREAGLGDSIRLLGGHLAGPGDLARFAAGAPLNTDDNPLVLFQAPALAYRKQDDPGARLLGLLGRLNAKSAPSWIRDPELAARVRDYKAARDLYLGALVLESSGDPAGAAQACLASVRASRDFTASYARLLTLAGALAGTRPEAARGLLEDLEAARPEVPVARQLLERLGR